MVQVEARQEFERLLQDVAGSAYRVAYGYTHDRDDAMDLVQEATVLAYKGFDTFQPGSNFKAWFLRILTNKFLKSRARKRVDTVALEEAGEVYLYRKTQDHGLQGNPEDPARLVLDGLETEAVQQAIDRLPDEFRTASLLYFLNEFNYEEIATVLDVPVGTVRSRLHRGRKLLQKALWDVAAERGIVPADPGDERV